MYLILIISYLSTDYNLFVIMCLLFKTLGYILYCRALYIICLSFFLLFLLDDIYMYITYIFCAQSKIKFIASWSNTLSIKYHNLNQTNILYFISQNMRKKVPYISIYKKWYRLIGIYVFGMDAHQKCSFYFVV
jgi:hypothetical protein